MKTRCLLALAREITSASCCPGGRVTKLPTKRLKVKTSPTELFQKGPHQGQNLDRNIHLTVYKGKF